MSTFSQSDLSGRNRLNGLLHLFEDVERMYESDSTLRNGYAILGNAFLMTGQYRLALEIYERDRISYRLSSDYRHILGYIFAKLDRYTEAKAEIQRAFLEDPSLIYGYHLVNPQNGYPHPYYGKRITDGMVESGVNQETTGVRNDRWFRLIDQSEKWCRDSEIAALAYAKDNGLSNSYPFCGNVLSAYAQYKSALRSYLKGSREDRLSPLQRILYAKLLARAEDVQSAMHEVKCAYHEDPNIQDGYAFIGTVFRNSGQFDKALEFYSKDNELGRLSAAQRHIYADQLARAGRVKEAKREAERGYRENPTLYNGFARIGNVLRVKGDLQGALSLYRRDQMSNRLTSHQKLLMAELLAQLGDLDASKEQVKKAYSIDSTLTDGYACIGNVLRKQGRIEEGLAFFYLDCRAERLSPSQECVYAEMLAHDGNYEAALSEVGNAYNRDVFLKDGYARLARVKYNSHDWDTAFELFNRDYELGRLSEKARSEFIQACAHINIARLLHRFRLSGIARRTHAFCKRHVDTLKARTAKAKYPDDWLRSAANKHKSDRLFIVGTGPSLNCLDLDRLSGEVVMGVNGTYMLETLELNYFIYASTWWHKQHIEGISNVQCKRRFLPEDLYETLNSEMPTSWYRKISPQPWSRFQKPLPEPAGFSKKPYRFIYAGGTVIYVCLQLAYYFGFKEIILIGLDHNYGPDNGSFYRHGGTQIISDPRNITHFSDRYVTPGSRIPINFKAMEKAYSKAKAVFDAAGRRIINASANTKLAVFPVVDYNSLF